MTPQTDKEIEELAVEYSMRFDKENKFNTANSGDARMEQLAFKVGYRICEDHMQKLSEDQSEAIDKAGEFYGCEKTIPHTLRTCPAWYYAIEDYKQGAKFGISLERAKQKAHSYVINSLSQNIAEISEIVGFNGEESDELVSHVKDTFEKLKAIIEGKLSEDDEFGTEFVIKQILEEKIEKLKAENAELKDENGSLKFNLTKKQGEIGRAEHRGNTVDYIYDKCATYGAQFEKQREEIEKLRKQVLDFQNRYNEAIGENEKLRAALEVAKGLILSVNESHAIAEPNDESAIHITTRGLENAIKRICEVYEERARQCQKARSE